MKAKKSDLLNLWYILESLKHQKQNTKFSYFLAKNKIAIKNEVDALNEASEASEAFKLYDQKRADLAASMADKVKETDEPMTSNGQYVIKEKKEDFEKGLEALKVEFKDCIDERTTQIEAFAEILKEEADFNGHSIKLDNLPADIEPAVMEGLLNVELVTD